jgi:hypothetical protein
MPPSGEKRHPRRAMPVEQRHHRASEIFSCTRNPIALVCHILTGTHSKTLPKLFEAAALAELPLA